MNILSGPMTAIMSFLNGKKLAQAGMVLKSIGESMLVLGTMIQESEEESIEKQAEEDEEYEREASMDVRRDDIRRGRSARDVHGVQDEESSEEQDGEYPEEVDAAIYEEIERRHQEKATVK